MKPNARTVLTTTSAVLALGLVALARSAPPQGGNLITFQSGTPAKASEVNANFALVDSKAQQALDAAASALGLDANGNLNIGSPAFGADVEIRGNLTEALTGVVSISAGNNTIIGSGTQFTTELEASDPIKVAGEILRVQEIISDTELTLTSNPVVTAAGVPAFIDQAIMRIQDGAGLAQVFVDGQGHLGLGTATPRGSLERSVASPRSARRARARCSSTRPP
jgi:hypothetical protein